MEHVWFNGSLLPAADVAIGPMTHALHYGSGVFEGIRAYETATTADESSHSIVFRLDDHLERLYKSAHVYGLDIPYTLEELRTGVFETLEANGMRAGYIRPLVYFAERGIALAPKGVVPTHVLIALRPLSGSLIGGMDGARVTVSPWQKTPSAAMPSTAKACGQYLNSILALQDALARGFDEAILLNDRGEVAEGSGENIFVVKNGVLHTNDERADILLGITRQTILDIAQAAGMRVEIGVLTPRQLLEADEAFFTGTAAEVMAIAQVDNTVLPKNRPYTTFFQTAYTNLTKGDLSMFALHNAALDLNLDSLALTCAERLSALRDTKDLHTFPNHWLSKKDEVRERCVITT